MTVTDPSSFDDAYIPLAFSMYSTPGAYAVLAGAGVSFGSVKTAWDIVVELAQRLCRIGDPATADTLDHANVEAWFERTQGERLTYGGLLAKVAPLPNERGAVLTKFFEQEGPDGEPQLPTPTDAHRAVARLVAAGIVRVIVTMNFDHLFEAALKEIGIEPHVISTESGAEGRQPLHTMTCCVVHLHGSYRDASSMLNTDTELGHYKPKMQTLLNEIVRTHGLLIAGWSAQWDQALRDTIIREHRAFYTPAWIDPNPLRTDAQVVATTISYVRSQPPAGRFTIANLGD
ncbi:hypothetical protein G3I13_17695 [Streptomyces sp. SID6673]|nr:hypothetical protein [Streptomyces sp. SID11726]NEB26170.1 hypothetical protein [Streptomyces sp. SID6673]